MPRGRSPLSTASFRPAPVSQAFAGGKRVLNVLPDVFDLRDRLYAPALRPLPEAVDGRPHVPVVLDQGPDAACTGFGLAAVVNLALARSGRPGRVSERFLYENARRHDEWQGEAYEGSSLRGAMKGFLKHGACDEELLPWDPGWSMDAAAWKKACANADVRPLGAYYRVATSSINDLQGALTDVGAVLVSANVHSGWDTLRKRKGDPLTDIAWDPAKPRTPLGGHAFALVGYDARGFIVQNSWGTGWGTKGFARLTYEDWLANRVDAWVAQLGVGRAAFANPPGKAVSSLSGRVLRKASDAEIGGHYLAIVDGQWDERGDIRTRPGDLPAILDGMRARFEQQGAAPRRILLFAHGGLVDEDTAAAKTLDFKDVMLANGIYPLHVLWHTGFWETCGDICKPPRPGIAGFSLGEAWDGMLEALARPLGRAQWRDMKRDAEEALKGCPGARTGPLAQFLTLYRSAGLDAELHLVGHSAGSILLSHAVEWCLNAGVKVDSLSFLAPAATVALFRQKVMPHVASGRIPRFTMWTMEDRDERDDACALYRKSLLYFVSNAFEEAVPTTLLGLDRHIRKDMAGSTRWVDPAVAEFLADRVRWHRPSGKGGSLHGSFDDDPAVVNGLIRAITEQEPVKPYV